MLRRSDVKVMGKILYWWTELILRVLKIDQRGDGCIILKFNVHDIFGDISAADGGRNNFLNKIIILCNVHASVFVVQVALRPHVAQISVHTPRFMQAYCVYCVCVASEKFVRPCLKQRTEACRYTGTHLLFTGPLNTRSSHLAI